MKANCDRTATTLARCDLFSARIAGIDCAKFYARQAHVAAQVSVLRQRLRSLGAVLKTGMQSDRPDRATTVRLDKYMGVGTAVDYDKVALVNNVLFNAERQLRSMTAIARFDRNLGRGGETQPGFMRFGNELNDNTILHEAVHFGTAVWRSRGGVPFIPDQGNFGSYQTYGTLGW